MRAEVPFSFVFSDDTLSLVFRLLFHPASR
jgi:hypothetical protein